MSIDIEPRCKGYFLKIRIKRSDCGYIPNEVAQHETYTFDISVCEAFKRVKLAVEMIERVGLDMVNRPHIYR